MAAIPTVTGEPQHGTSLRSPQHNCIRRQGGKRAFLLAADSGGAAAGACNATQRDVTHRQLALSAASALIVDAVEKAEGPRSSSSRGETSTPCACSSSAYKSSPFEFDIIL